MADAWAIEASGVIKRFADREALRGLDLRVPRGSIFGFLGRNGAGKTTAIKTFLSMVRPDAGTARVLGLPADDPRASVDIRRRTGFVSEEKDLYDAMTVAEIIRFTAGFFPQWRPDAEQQYLRRFDLPLTRRVSSLSRGMRTQLALLLALCRGAELLMLDEPTSGLDPAVTEDVLQALVHHAASEGATVFFSSHQIAEVEQIADHLAIIDRGRTVVAGSVDDLRQEFCRVQLVFDGDAPAAVFHAPGIERVRRQGRVLSVLSSAGPAAVIEEARALGPRSIDTVPVSLKDIFLESVATQE